MATSFTADVDAWVRQTEARMMAVFKQSAQDVMREASKPVAQGGNMPVDTGFLRNSVAHSVDGTQFAKGGDEYTLAIARMRPGQSYRAAWTAAYALAVHFGSRGRSGRMFAALAAQRWQEFVTKNARALRRRVLSR